MPHVGSKRTRETMVVIADATRAIVLKPGRPKPFRPLTTIKAALHKMDAINKILKVPVAPINSGPKTLSRRYGAAIHNGTRAAN